HDHLQIFGIDFVPDQVFDLGHVLFGHLKASAGRDFEVNCELPCVSPGEKCQAKQRIQGHTHQEQGAESCHGKCWTLYRTPHPDLIEVKDAVEHAIEASGEAVPPGVIRGGCGLDIVFICAPMPHGLRNGFEETRAE